MPPIMSTKTVAIRTQSWRMGAPEAGRAVEAEVAEVEGGGTVAVPRISMSESFWSAALRGAPAQGSRGPPRHQQHTIDGPHSEILELDVGQDLDRDGPC